MSEENVKVVRAIFERFNRDGYLPEELFTPDLELSNARESPIPGPYRGYTGLRMWREDLFEVVDEGRFEIEELIDADAAAAVVTRVRIRGRAAYTAIDVDIPFTIVGWMRDGRMYRSRGYFDHAEALKAAGLSE